MDQAERRRQRSRRSGRQIEQVELVPFVAAVVGHVEQLVAQIVRTGPCGDLVDDAARVSGLAASPPSSAETKTCGEPGRLKR